MDIRPGPGLRIILLEDDPQGAELLVAARFDQSASEMLRGGAADFVRKDDLGRLAAAITAALNQRAPLGRLSARQREVLQLLAAGSSMREIASRLDLSVKTVETHRA